MQNLVLKAIIKAKNITKETTWSLSGISKDLIKKVLAGIETNQLTLTIPAS